MRLSDIDPIEERIFLLQRSTYTPSRHWILHNKNVTLTFEYRQDAEAYYIKQRTHDPSYWISVYYEEEDRELTNYTEQFEKLLPKVETPKPSFWQSVRQYLGI